MGSLQPDSDTPGAGRCSTAKAAAARTATFAEPGIVVAGGGNIGRSTNWENGWTAGVGMEFAFTDRWSAKAEYMHYEFPQYAFTVAQGVTANASTTGDIVRIGVNYHFRP
jgi:opacity protein-like surface antigen